MNERLAALKQELEKGQHQMTLLDQRRHELRDTILRISGAIQVLEELQAQVSPVVPVLAEPARPLVSTAA
jgi:prefoldin subunit 5